MQGRERHVGEHIGLIQEGRELGRRHQLVMAYDVAPLNPGTEYVFQKSGV